MPISLAPREKIALFVGCLLSFGLLLAASSGRARLGWSEVWGFITGALGVYLLVKGNVWNFPIGLANNLFFGVLFWQSRLFNDFGLQIVYFVLGAWGWWFWTRGVPKNEAENRAETLPIGRATKLQLGWSLAAVPLLTLVLTLVSQRLGGASPFWDALTTALSLVAQYLLGRKWIENWALWIAADLIYVPLYFSRGLTLTAVLYAGFLLLCIWGFRAWKADIQRQNA